jgi:hypothetical protein
LGDEENMLFWKSKKKTDQVPGNTTGEGLVDDLSELGISLDSTVTDPSTALLGGISKADLRFTYRNLKKGNVDQAISGAASLIQRLEKDPAYQNLLRTYPAYKRVLGAAYYVLGLGHEAKDMKAEAAIDFRMAMLVHPGFSPAEQGFNRVILSK